MNKSSAELWADYLFLTQEINKFIDKRDLDLVLELINQREKLQTIIGAAKDGFGSRPEEQSLLKRVETANVEVRRKLELLRNSMQRQKQAATAYEGYRSNNKGHMEWQR